MKGTDTSMKKEQTQQILKDIAKEFGEDIFLDNNRVQGLLSDYFTSEIKTKKMLANAIRENLPKKLLDFKALSEIERETNIGKIKYYYKEDNGLDENTADFVVEAFIYALEVLPSIHTTTANRANQTHQVVASLPAKVFTSDDVKKYEKNNVVEIPYGFTKIDESAFCYCNELLTVKIPDSVREIGWNCFSDCNNLVSIKIPDGVTSIGGQAFDNCYKIVSITIPNSVLSIGHEAFDDCYNLKEVTIPDSVTSIEYDLFGKYYSGGNTEKIKCSKGSYAEKYLLENSLGSYIEYIDNSQLMKTNKPVERELQNIVFTREDIKKYEKDNKVQIPYGFTVIDNLAFHSCENLTSIDIPDSVTSIEEFAFSSCTNLTSIRIPDNVTSIGRGTFYYCTSLNSIIIPNGVKSIDYYAFYNCKMLNSIKIPESVTKIGESAFYNCRNLSSVVISSSVSSIGDHAFSFCDSLVVITIPEGVTSIGRSAFSFCDNLVEITIPDSVTCIGENVFYFSGKLKVVKCKRGSYVEKYMKENSLGNLIVYI